MIPLSAWRPREAEHLRPTHQEMEYGPDYLCRVWESPRFPSLGWIAEVCIPAESNSRSSHHESESQAKAWCERKVVALAAEEVADANQKIWNYSPPAADLVRRLRLHGLTGPKHGLSREIGNLLLEAAQALMVHNPQQETAVERDSNPDA